eukprot:TRINITY_DN6340_c0_g1_i1.p1 TRINITY_DN6340_c0_g1~~TRINITY_DN6340_c0_g1_i1.p1  ORF type:complete len:634 (+),score=55.25 TRINITY_DN6340_c0_g1_i1:316-2217(+)
MGVRSLYPRRERSGQGSHFWFYFALVALMLSLHISTVSCSDADVLLDFAKLQLNGTTVLSSWRADNVTNVCRWERVACNSNGQVTLLQLAAEYQKPFLRGLLPMSIMNLTAIEMISIEHNEIVGDFPIEFWNKPTLKVVIISNTALKVKFPARLPSSLFFLAFERTIFSGNLPEMNWNNMQVIEGSSTDLQCPLPQGLVDRIMSLTNPFALKCSFRLSSLTIDSQNRVCGQIPISKFVCRFYPLVNRPVPPSTMPFSFNFGNLTLEFERDRVFLYRAYSDKGVRKVFREEYATFQFFPLSQVVDNGSSDYLQGGAFVELQSVFWNSSTVLVAKATQSLLNGTVVAEYIFDFAPPQRPQTDQAFVKLSIRYKNYGIQWLPTSNVGTVLIPITIYFRGTHSPFGGPALACSNTDGESCTSERSRFDIRVFILATPPYSQLIYRTKKVLFDYSYGIVGSLDGVPLNAFSEGVEATIVKFFSSVGYIETVYFHQNNNESARLDSLVEEESQQYIALAARLHVPVFRDELLYDPDFSMDLLFDPSSNDKSAPAVTADLDSAALSSVAIALIVVAIVVAIAIVILMPTVIFPFVKRRTQQVELGELDEAKDAEPEQQRLSTPESNGSSWRRIGPSVSGQ